MKPKIEVKSKYAYLPDGEFDGEEAKLEEKRDAEAKKLLEEKTKGIKTVISEHDWDYDPDAPEGYYDEDE